MPKATNAQSTQQFVPIKEIRDGIVILKNGALRSVFMASSLNFALKSYDEQKATLNQFQNFLNALDFSIQFFIESKELDIRPYIATLEEREKAQTNELLQIQTREYINFIKEFTETADIMTKTFYVVVPYTPPAIEGARSLSKFLPFGKKEKGKGETETARFEEQRTQLEQRMAVVEQGLVRTGVRVVQLGTEELIELYYRIFNPGDLEKPIQLNQEQNKQLNLRT